MPSLRMLRKLKNELKLNQILGNTISPSSPSLPPTPPPPHSKLERIADEFLSLNKVQKHDFATLFKLKLGIDRYAHLAAASGGAAVASASSSSSDSNNEAPAAAVAQAKSIFAVKLEKYDATAKIKIIKEVRAFTDLGLKEAKDLVEKVPAVLRTGLSKEEADTIIDKLKQLGATAIAE